MGDKQISLRIREDRRDVLTQMSNETGIKAADLVRNALYEKLAEWEKSKQ